MEDNIIAIFNRYDTNGDGCIERHELASVLRRLDAEQWTDGNIDMLIGAIDTNKDGKLSISEFVHWINGDDQEFAVARAALTLAGNPVLRPIVHHHMARHKFRDLYELEAYPTDERPTGSLYTATQNSSQKEFTVHAIKMSNVNRSDLLEEIQILTEMDHPNIIRLFEVFEDKQLAHMVMEYCSGGNLFDRLLHETCFSEVSAVHLMQQIVSGALYMHQRSICFRDISPENLRFKEPCAIDRCVIKYFDFASACRCEEESPLWGTVGEVLYGSPEMLAGMRYGMKTDMWSIGVISYFMLCGYPPFVGENDMDTVDKVITGALCFYRDDWRSSSDSSKDFIRGLLNTDTVARMSPEAALKHPWLQENQIDRCGEVSTQQREHLMTNMKAFAQHTPLKKAALHAVAARLDEFEILSLRSLFLDLDKNQDGTVSLFELKEGLDKLGLNGVASELQKVMEAIDVDGSRSISYTEFVAATLDARQFQKESVCQAAFQAFDANGDGMISREELGKVLESGDLGEGFDNDAVAQAIQDCDTNGDGTIDFREFMKVMSTPESVANSKPKQPAKPCSLSLPSAAVPRRGSAAALLPPEPAGASPSQRALCQSSLSSTRTSPAQSRQGSKKASGAASPVPSQQASKQLIGPAGPAVTRQASRPLSGSSSPAPSRQGSKQLPPAAASPARRGSSLQHGPSSPAMSRRVSSALTSSAITAHHRRGSNLVAATNSLSQCEASSPRLTKTLSGMSRAPHHDFPMPPGLLDFDAATSPTSHLRPRTTSASDFTMSHAYSAPSFSRDAASYSQGHASRRRMVSKIQEASELMDL